MTIESLRETMRRHVERGALAGLVFRVTRNGETHTEGLGMREDALFRIASMTKPISAAVTMLLVRDGTLSLDGPITEWLPELADRRVLRALDAPLDDTSPTERPIRVEHLLTMRLGLGAIMARGDFPILAAMRERGIAPHWKPPIHQDADAWVEDLAELPLMHQPGTTFRYDTSMVLLGALLERASGQTLPALFESRVFEPLEMHDTGFFAKDPQRLGPARAGSVEVDAGGLESRWATPPGFASAACGLVSTAADYGRFVTAMREHSLLSARECADMYEDRIPESGQTFFGEGFWENFGWGYGLAVVRRERAEGPRGVGWSGGLGTTCFWTEEDEAMLLTQELMTGPDDPPHFADFFREVRSLGG